MCLYPNLIKNRKYTPNKKNGGNVPELEDMRMQYVPVGCGNCIECRKQKAREWQVRLTEELKIHKRAYFVTLTFSNENLEKLANNLKTNGETNAVAGLAVRRFLERWRKAHKKSIKHWLITELGHTGTERIHLHGILFPEEELTNEKLAKFWQYGLCDTGKYCNNRTINYIIKYVTKIDLDHKDYKAEIFCSAGLGANYLNEYNKYAHRYQGKETKQYYTLPNGEKVNLPIYYRNKLWTDDQRQELWGYMLDDQTIYVRGIPCKVRTNNEKAEYWKVLQQQQRDNIALGFGDRSKEWRKKDYNVKFRELNAISISQNGKKIK